MAEILSVTEGRILKHKKTKGGAEPAVGGKGQLAATATFGGVGDAGVGEGRSQRPLHRRPPSAGGNINLWGRPLLGWMANFGRESGAVGNSICKSRQAPTTAWQASIPVILSPKPAHTQGTWERISIQPLPRPLHSIDIVEGIAYVFGGEINPLSAVIVQPSSGVLVDYDAVEAVAI
ncbi:hypothetical protein QBC46DRAFT_445225 [Diplogelasinospora grovesii]|uniref:Uncharacterized protein n=1 Tax=Diplogelasinospora grovesii TaxID=303347 RepID=A0AAN6S9T6_9PEZI|nr:hypothetical protein QBC46DRAFT_445225 [Diplogelasinospora grovesii]